jgi:hypothetical protein
MPDIIRAVLFEAYSTGDFLTFLKQRGFKTFPITN